MYPELLATISLIDPQHSISSIEENAGVRRRKSKVLLSKDQLREICARIEGGEAVSRIANDIGIEHPRLQYAIAAAGISVQGIVKARRASLKAKAGDDIRLQSEETKEYITALTDPGLYRILKSYARRLCHDGNAAEDLVQVALFKACTAIISYDPQKGSIKAWTKAIIYNAFIDNCRKKAPARALVDIDLVGNEAATPNLQPHVVDHVIELEHVMKRLFVQLPEDQQRTMTLHVFHGHTHEEIVAQTGLPLGTVKSQIRLARETLNKLRESPTIAAEELGYGPANRLVRKYNLQNPGLSSNKF